VAGERIRLEVQARDAKGSGEARRLRKQGLIPGVLYGKGKKSYAICVPERELRRVLTGDHGLHAILDVVVAGDGDSQAHASILKDYQQDPLRGKITHIDLQEVPLDEPIVAAVVVELVGGQEAPGVKAGGVLSQVVREIRVQALPMEIPEHLVADVSRMELGDTLRLADLAAIERVTFVDDPETVLATVTVPTRVEEPEVEEVEGEEGEVVEGAEGEEAPEGEAEAPAEPQAEAAGGEGTTEG
jgi:large subunit ribosomal protein L25